MTPATSPSAPCGADAAPARGHQRPARRGRRGARPGGGDEPALRAHDGADRRRGRCRRAAQGRRAPLRRLATGLPSTSRRAARASTRASAGGRSATGRSLICHDALTDPRVNAARVAATGVRSMIAVPLLHAGEPVGSLLVLAQAPGRLRRRGRAHARAAVRRDLGGHEPRGRVSGQARAGGGAHALPNDLRGSLRRHRAHRRRRPRDRGQRCGAGDAGLLRRTSTRSAASKRSRTPTTSRRASSCMRQLMDGERDAYEHDKRYIRKDGEVIWAHVRAWLEPPAEGEPRTAIAMIENINERKLAEIALRDEQRTAGAPGRDAARHRGCRRGPRERDAADRRALAGADRRPTARSSA